MKHTIVQQAIQNIFIIPDSKIHGANMGPIWGRQVPGGPHVGTMNFAIWDSLMAKCNRDIANSVIFFT